MKIKKKVSTDTKLAGRGIRYYPKFVATNDAFEDLSNLDVRLKDLKNVNTSPSRITSVGFMSVVLMPMSILLTKWAIVCHVVLRNITLTVLEKTILQLPDFKPVDAVVHSVDLPSTSKQECNQSSSDHELALLRNDVKMLTEKVSSMENMKSSFELIFRALDIKNAPKVGTSIGDNDGDNLNKKDDETLNVGGTGDDQVNDPPNVGQQNDVVLKVDHISDNLMDDVGKTTDCVGGDVIRHLVDNVGEKVNFVGDYVGGHVDVDSVAETLTKFTQPFRDQKKQKEGDVAVLSQDELDWSEIPNAEISKFTQPDKSVATTDATDLVCDNVRKVYATASDNVKGIEENMMVASVMLDETPVISRRLCKPAAVCETPFLSKFNSGCGKVEGQSSKRIENAQPSKCVLSIKHPFVKSITERIDDIKVTLKFNKFVTRSLRVKHMPVYSGSINALRKHFDYGVDTVKMKESFFTLAYSEVRLTDSHIDVIFYYLLKKSKYGPVCDTVTFTTTDCWLNCLIQNLYKHFVENNRDVTLITQEHQIAEYMLDFFMRCNVPWNSIDNVLFPINLAEEFHWVLERLSFKDQCIYVYDSMHGSRHAVRVHKSVAAYSELIPHFFSCIGFWESRSDGLSVANSFDICIVDGLPTQANNNILNYLLDGLQISNHLDDIDAIRIRYGVLLWDYGKKKQSQCAVSEDKSTGRLLKKKDGVQQI
ncbi:hypothetical protein FXO37_05723 [Capsicum annuum]|nr:hypothetical protein FXO37_05723 [Capsicum annuum]